ncbi:hypothetical protein [Bacteroides neonati]|uniref:hypothetical protein n=1 Tax=Bacteroides neonati TaxID=1347393 RepID=UPI0005AA9323|nr:hypothetical protein [Bacteroides neonati]
MNELIINGKDAFLEYGIKMGEGFLDAIFSPAPIKDFVENKSRLTGGKQVIYNNPKVDERDITLTFNLEGDSPGDYLVKCKKFKEELSKGLIIIEVPVLGETYRLTYGKSVTFAMNTERTFSKISCKFNEPNPSSEGRR